MARIPGITSLGSAGARVITRVVERVRHVVRTDPNIGTLRGMIGHEIRPPAQRFQDMAAVRRFCGTAPELAGFDSNSSLAEIVTGRTFRDADDHPLIGRPYFGMFTDRVPHLFQAGQGVLDWSEQLGPVIAPLKLPNHLTFSINDARRVVEQLVMTAAITAPADLWLAKQLLTTYHQLGTLTYLNNGGIINVEAYAGRAGWNPRQLATDLSFFYARGYLRREGNGYAKSLTAAGCNMLEEFQPLDDEFRTDMASELVEWFWGHTGGERGSRILKWLDYDRHATAPTRGWQATTRDMEIGYRLLPVITALHAAGLIAREGKEVWLRPSSAFTAEFTTLFIDAGLMDEGKWTPLGRRVLSKAAGPFGIIGSYHEAAACHAAILTGRGRAPLAMRGPNIAASQSAHRAIFSEMNDSLDRFCEKTGWKYGVYIEHAVGMAEGIRNRWERNRARKLWYLGADFEARALAETRRLRDAGKLPADMDLIQADIADPDIVINHIGPERIAREGAVMVVSAGFHEIRNQTDEGMVDSFRRLADADIVLIFNETPRLTADQIRATASNTSQAAFNWTHTTSGQGLRAYEDWRQLVEDAGYVVLPEYSMARRRIFPCPMPDADNPPISMTYFCVPKRLAAELNLV